MTSDAISLRCQSSNDALPDVYVCPAATPEPAVELSTLSYCIAFTKDACSAVVQREGWAMDPSSGLCQVRQHARCLAQSQAWHRRDAKCRIKWHQGDAQMVAWMQGLIQFSQDHAWMYAKTFMLLTCLCLSDQAARGSRHTAGRAEAA